MKWFADLKLGTRLISSFIVVAVIAGAIGTIGSININKLNNMETGLYENNLKRTAYMGRWLESFNAIRTATRDIFISDDPAYQEKRKSDISRYRETMNGYMRGFEERIATEQGRKMYEDLLSEYEEYKVPVDRLIELSIAGRKEEARDVLYGELITNGDEVNLAAVALMERQLEQAEETDRNFTATADASTLLMIVLAIVGMIIAVLLGFFITRLITRPVQTLVEASRKVADGDLNVTIDIRTKDEIGTLAQAFGAMTDSMNEVLHNIANASEQVASGSRQVSEASQELSQGSTEQASSIQQLTASMEQIASQTKMNAKSAEQANELALSASADAEQGNGQMKEMLAAMEQINESSGNISKIIKVIDEIAFQTNILALNAAVEAARAGQHGKGFAVVAEEVRNLAARSANAAKETTVLIEGSIKKVEAGTRIANDTARALEKIVGGVGKAADLVGSIASASNEQAAGIAQANQGIAQVSEVVQANSATSEECAAASEELSGQSEQLKEMVGKFRLKRSAASFVGGYDAFATGSASRRAPLAPAFAEVAAASATGKPIIRLDDEEFGKYE